MASGGSSISRSGRDVKDRREGEDGCDSSSLRSRSRSGRLSRDIDGELGGGSGSAYGDDRKDGIRGEGSNSYGERGYMGACVGDGTDDCSWSTSIE
jgi:hypothetical protein